MSRNTLKAFITVVIVFSVFSILQFQVANAAETNISVTHACSRHGHNQSEQCIVQSSFDGYYDHYEATYTIEGHRHGSSYVAVALCFVDASGLGTCKEAFSGSGDQLGPEIRGGAEARYPYAQGEMGQYDRPNSYIFVQSISGVIDAQVWTHIDATAWSDVDEPVCVDGNATNFGDPLPCTYEYSCNINNQCVVSPEGGPFTSSNCDNQCAPAPPGPGVICSPTNQNVGTNQNVSITGSSGEGSWSWSAPGGDPTSDNDPFFNTQYSVGGLKTVTVTRGSSSAQCSVNVNDSGGGGEPPDPGEACTTYCDEQPLPPAPPGCNYEKTCSNCCGSGNTFDRKGLFCGVCPFTPVPTPTPLPGCDLNGGSINSGGFKYASDNGPEKAFDGQTDTYYRATDKYESCEYDEENDKNICEWITAPEVYIGRTYSNGVSVRQIDATKTGDATFNGPIQYSENGNTWTNAGFSFAVPKNFNGFHVIELPNLGSHKYWRVLDSRDDAFHQIAELQFFDCPNIPPTVEMRANNKKDPITVPYNSIVTLSWTVKDGEATTCTASVDWSGPKSTISGSQNTDNLIIPKTYNYTLSCTGPGGTNQDTAIVTVEAAPVPVAYNVTITEPNYCVSGPAATTTWAYADSSGSPQTAYQVQIDNQSSFNSPEVDTGKVLCGSCGSYFVGQGSLQFNTTYGTRVRVWNSSDSPSPWQEATICSGDGCQPNAKWKTPSHAYPNASSPYQFSYSPSNPAVSSPVQFTDHAWFDPSSNNKSWSWTFVPAGGGSGSSTAQNPSYTFNSNGIYQVTESVRDNALPPGQFCTGPTQSVNIQKPIPIWKEIAPR